jgi:hypothetical protein
LQHFCCSKFAVIAVIAVIAALKYATYSPAKKLFLAILFFIQENIVKNAIFYCF